MKRERFERGGCWREGSGGRCSRDRRRLLRRLLRRRRERVKVWTSRWGYGGEGVDLYVAGLVVGR